MDEVKRTIERELDLLVRIAPDTLVAERRRRYRQMGVVPGRFPQVGGS